MTATLANPFDSRKRRKARAAVALMRKLVKALYHVGRGAPFDSAKLFDVARLELAA